MTTPDEHFERLFRLDVTHITPSQAARALGLSQASVHARISTGRLQTQLILGVKMVAVAEVRSWYEERRARHS